MKRKIAYLFLILLVVQFIIPLPQASADQVVKITVHAKQYEFVPNKINVKQGDRVKITLIADDVTHGLFIDGYDIKAYDQPKDPEVGIIEFVADKTGNFTFRCPIVCGPMHPFMIGTLVVDPNPTFPIALFLTIGIGMTSLFYVYRRSDELVKNVQAPKEGIDLNKKYPWLEYILNQRWIIYLIFIVNTFFFAIVIFAGFAGTNVGNANFSLIFVWILWWALLIIILLPIGGRLWCTICPIPAPGEWIDRRAFIDKGCEKAPSVAIKGWPKGLKNIWLQNWSFLLVALFSGIILTRPLATSIVLSFFIVLAIITTVIYGKRIFCRYMCPVGGFIGLYSLLAPLGVRVRDKGTCRAHKDKECIVGNEKAYGCPWMETPWTMERNAYCGLCLECFKSCSQKNIALNWQSFGADLLVEKGKKLDEAYKAFIMLTCALAYSVIFQGPWGIFKTWANMSMPGFFIYAGGFLVLNLLIVPLLFALFVWIGKGLAFKDFSKIGHIFTPIVDMLKSTKSMFVPSSAQAEAAATAEKSANPSESFKKLFIDLSYVLVPMGLACWMAFSVSFLFINIVYILHVISDPFGWGWNLFGTKGLEWKPVGTGVYPYIQAFILFFGLIYSNWIGAKIIAKYPLDKGQKFRLLLPITVFLMAITALFLWLYI
ncbi:hypothetical protein BHU72_05475 [Desulfuribacillus stibiiarsenatis]|uniref:Cytochrome aa3 subunit 2 n=1 Tax=Desulfuribacillus stibiiarsenatis TaxID=1390249 RepID=A0A1E5L4M7_9FIRM|nr:4Fe-4S binding protein [Desulfuribacillus stibiiarsenatis]OEH85061.1 hypothetical protein BHU72_05475 [Desulfuribacillus stibiiarsenatis]